jgi:hypothetical protein
VNAFQGVPGGGEDAFVAELAAPGTTLVYSTYLGGKENDVGYGIVVDSSDHAYVTGLTGSPNFPITPEAFQPTCGTDGNCNFDGSQYLTDAFVAKLSSTGDALIYSTYLGGGGNDGGNAIAIDANGNAYVTGYTLSTDFPTAHPVQAVIGGGADVFVSELNASGSALIFSTFLGGTGVDAGKGIALSSSGNLYIAGVTGSTDFPVTVGAFQTQCGSPAYPCISTGLTDAFVANFTGFALTASLAPSTLTFDMQLRGTSSPAQAVTLTNKGSAALTMKGISITGPDSADFAETNTCGTSVAAGANCTINVTFTPTADGTRTAVLSVADSAANGPQTVSLTGTGTDPAAAVSPPSLTFSGQTVGTTSGSQPVALHNTGTAPLTIAGIGYTTNFGETNNCGASVAANGSCTINVTFTPKAAGPLSGTLTINDNSNNSPQKVALTGTGVNPVPTLTALSPSSATAGRAAFALTVTGTNFVSTSTVQWQGRGLTTKYVSGTKLTASVPASDIATEGTASVTVTNPTPGGGASNGLTFTIR